MYQTRSRQLARLEKRVSLHADDGNYKWLQWRLWQHGVLGHAVILAFLIRDGKPKIGEPLFDAFQRFEASKAWQACCDQFPTQARMGVHGVRRTDDREY